MGYIENQFAFYRLLAVKSFLFRHVENIIFWITNKITLNQTLRQRKIIESVIV